MNKTIICLLLPLTLCGCLAVSYTDVSEKPKYNHFIGKNYEVIGKVDAYLIDESSFGLDPYISIKAPPGVEGSEVVSVDRLYPGTILTVTGVERTNRIFECRTSLILAPIESLKEKGRKYKTRMELMIGNQGEKCGELNPNHYREISPNK